MNGSRRLASLAVVAALCLMLGNVTSARAQAAAAAGGQDAAKPQYTMAEYNAYTAAQATKDPTAQIKALDDFIAKYPSSALLIYVYPLYFNAYSQLKNWPKVIEYADKTLALGDKIEAPVK
jgi:FMN-dependent NADH-azoreductase